ncbi:unnamed protein product [Symbiodinium necroappetens]|uniref:Uncharacterized protein n=1 Tax=Symbiodinium necroappetens TaxID=1628268 RepID=A0A812N5M2_9DINO|nr:unnamed protein product [Symbiodinium necroappetens]
MKRGTSAIFTGGEADADDGDNSATAARVPKAVKQHSIVEDSDEKTILGPSCLREAFKWPVDMVSSIVENDDRRKRLTDSILHCKWTMTSSYSGLCTEECAFRAIQAGLRAHAEQLGLRENDDNDKAEVLAMEFESACDADGFCQALALAVPAARQPQHFFHQLDDCLVDEVQQRLNEMETSLPSLKNLGQAKQVRATRLQQRIEIYDNMGQYLLQKCAEPGSIIRTECFCVKHLQNCKLSTARAEAEAAQTSTGADAASTPGRRHSLEVAGLTCVAFSSYGKHEGLGHESMRPFYTWCILMRSREPSLLIMESASAFPKDKVRMFLEDKYHLEFVDHPGPCLHGWPIRRPRMYCLAFLRSQVTFVGSAAEYTALFKRTVEMDGDALFCLPQDHAQVVQELQLLCRKRGFQMTDEMKQEGWQEVYTANQQNVLRQHRAAMEKKHSDGDASRAYIVDLDQNVGFAQAGPWWPCIIRHGTIHSLQKGRHACLSELFAAQGFPTEPHLEACYSPAFLDKVKASVAQPDPRWSRSAWHKMIGNAMFVPTLGSMILYALSSIEWQPATLLKMRSSLTFSFEDSQPQDDLTEEMEADAGLGD